MRARWTRSSAWARVAAIAAVLLGAGCADGDDSDGDDVDDGSGLIDAAPDGDDAAAPDGGGVDGGTARAAEVCAVLCGAFAECNEQTADPLCDADCIADLAECSAAEVDALDACGAGECGELTDCVLAVECAAGSTIP